MRNRVIHVQLACSIISREKDAHTYIVLMRSVIVVVMISGQKAWPNSIGIVCLNEFIFNSWSSVEQIFVWINVNKNQMAITGAYDRFHFFLMYWESRLVFFIGMQDWLSKIYTKMYQLAAGQYALHRNTYTTYVQKWLLLYQGFSAHWVHLPWLLGTFTFSLGYGYIDSCRHKQALQSLSWESDGNATHAQLGPTESDIFKTTWYCCCH